MSCLVSFIRHDGYNIQTLVSQDGQRQKLEKAKITLNDCLACSGCITVCGECPDHTTESRGTVSCATSK